jgi:hypothetical protein
MSALYMVSPTVSRNTLVPITLPPAASGVNRMITIRIGNTNGRVQLQRASGDPLVIGWDDATQRLDNLRHYVTLASDGTTWWVIAMDAP